MLMPTPVRAAATTPASTALFAAQRSIGLLQSAAVFPCLASPRGRFIISFLGHWLGIPVARKIYCG